MVWPPPPSPGFVQGLPGYQAPAPTTFSIPSAPAPRMPGGGVPAAEPAPAAPLMQQVESQFGAPPPVEASNPGDNVRTSEGGGTYGESTDDSADGAVERQQLHDYVLDLGPGGRPAPQFIQDEGERYTVVGGKEGKSIFREATVDGPKRLRSAIDDSEKAQAERSTALGEFYDKESGRAAQAAAARAATREQDDIGMRERQRNMDQATQYYSDDLANQGKFWTNPGNIVSAIAYSLLPIFSNDPAIGAKLINQAVEQDMANRQHAASQTLGALQTNLSGYHKIMGDRQAGDLLAESEARRIAASEVERISQKFESPISKAKAAAIKEDLLMKSNMQRMQAYQAFGIHNDARVIPKALHDARAQGFEGAWEKYGSDTSTLDPQFKQSTGGAVNGSVGGTPSVATTSGKPLSAQDAAIFTSPKLTLHATLGGRVPGGVGMADVFRRSVARQAAADVGYVQGANPTAFNKAKIAIMDKAEKDIQGFSTQMAPIAQQKAGITMMQRDMDIIQRSEKNPDEFIGKLRSMSPQGFAAWYENTKRQFSGAPANSAEALQAQKADAAMRFRSLWADTQVDYYHAKAGANQAPGELANLKEVIHSGSSWSQVRSFVQNQSIKLDRQSKDILAGASNPLAAMLYMTQTGIGTTRLASKGIPLPKKGMDAVAPIGLGDVNRLTGAPGARFSGSGPDFKSGLDNMFLPPPPASPEAPPPPPPPARRGK